jgi:hypothetical protein
VVQVLSNGTVVARTSQGLLAMEVGAEAQPRSITLVRGREAAFCVDQRRQAKPVQWVTTAPKGVLLRCSDSNPAGVEMCRGLSGADAVLCNDATVIVARGDETFEARPLLGGDDSAELSLPAAESSLGAVMSPTVVDGRTAFAALRQNGKKVTATVAVVTTSGGRTEFRTEWTCDAELPTEDGPAAWCMADDGSAVVIVSAGAEPVVLELTAAAATERSFPALNGATVHDTVFVGDRAVAAIVRSGGAARLLRLSLKTAAATELSTVVPEVRKHCSLLIATHPAARDGAVVVCVDRNVFEVDLPASAVRGAAAGAVGAAAETRAEDSVAALLMSSSAAKAAPQQWFSDADVVKIVAAFRTSGAPGKVRPELVMRDDAFTAATAKGTTHRVVDPLLAKKEYGAVARYLAAATSVSAATMVRCLSDATPADSLTNDAALTAAANAAGSFLAATPADVSGDATAAVRSSVDDAAAPRLYSALYVVLLHAVATGRLEVVVLAVRLLDAVAVVHMDAVYAAVPETVTNTKRVLTQLGHWAMTEPGHRLGQLTAHCGPVSGALKEAAVVPRVAYRIATSNATAVRNETVSF